MSDVPERHQSWRNGLIAAGLVLLVGGVLLIMRANDTSPAPDSGAVTADQVAAAIGSRSCLDSGYSIRNAAGVAEIFDCEKDAGTICVIDPAGVASDVTDAVKVLFANSLTGKPRCTGP